MTMTCTGRYEECMEHWELPFDWRRVIGCHLARSDAEGLPRLHRPAYQVTFDVKNVGGLYGGEVSMGCAR
jgi:hypothetical protein